MTHIHTHPDTADVAPTSFDLRPVAGNLGAEVRGLDLRQQLDTTTNAQIHRALHRHGVLIFTGQRDLTAEHHRSFALSFGSARLPHSKLVPLEDSQYPEIAVISTDNGQAYFANRWHTDISWGAAPPRYSILHMINLPAAGGDTMWSSQHLAYETLSAPLKAMLQPLTAHHEQPGSPEVCADHPVVCRHPDTGRMALFVNDLFTVRINGLELHESAAILSMLNAHATRPEFTCRWQWSPGDIAIWDNHFVQHYAIYDYHDAKRRIHRIEIEGTPPLAA